VTDPLQVAEGKKGEAGPLLAPWHWGTSMPTDLAPELKRGQGRLSKKGPRFPETEDRAAFFINIQP